MALDMELFYSRDPLPLLENYSPEQLFHIYGQPTPELVAEDIWKRYGRIDLVRSSPPALFYDYRSGKYLDSINPHRMTPAAQLRLLYQMEPLIKNWPKDDPIWGLRSEMIARIEKIRATNAVLDSPSMH